MSFEYDLKAKKPRGFIGGILSKNSPEQMLRRDIEDTKKQVKFEGYVSEVNVSAATVSIYKAGGNFEEPDTIYEMSHFDTAALEQLAAKLALFSKLTAGEGFAISVEVYLGAETGEIVRIKC